VELEELGTKRRGTFLCTSGYEGREGELWYVRALPPPFERFDYGVVITTPYLLTGHTKRGLPDVPGTRPNAPDYGR
jgi:hypothetical protein